jgi:hypothetical protein
MPLSNDPYEDPTQPIDARRQVSASAERSTWGDLFHTAAPLIDAPAFYGPPVIFVLGPWLLLVLLLTGPLAAMVTVVLAMAVVAGLLAVLVAVIASPYLLIRHLHAHGRSTRNRVHPVTCSATTGSALAGSPHHNRKACHEDRGYRRDRPHRLKARQQAP